MSRFYQTSRSTPMDWAYDMPYQEMFQGLVAKQSIQDAGRAIGDKAEAQGQSLQYLNQDKEVAQEAMKWINDSVDQFSNQDLTDPVNRNKLNSFSKEVARAFSPNGQYGNVQGNYDAYQAYAKKLSGRKDLIPSEKDKALNSWLQNYQGVGGESRYGDDYNSFQSQDPGDTQNISKQLRETFLKADKDVRKNELTQFTGNYFKDQSEYSSLLPEERRQRIMQGVLSEPANQAYLQDALRYGYSPSINEQSMNAPMYNQVPVLNADGTPSLDKAGNPATRYELNNESYVANLYADATGSLGSDIQKSTKYRSNMARVGMAKIQAFNDANKPYLPETRDTSIKNRLKPELQSAIKDLSEGKSANVSIKLNEILSPKEYSEYLQGVEELKKARGSDIKSKSNDLRQKVSFWTAARTEGKVVDIGNLAFGDNNPELEFEFTDASQFTGAFLDAETKLLVGSLTGQTPDQINSMSGQELSKIAEKYDAWSDQNGMSLASATPLYGKAQDALNDRFFSQATGFDTEGKADKIMIRKPGSDEARLVTKSELEDMDKAIKEKVSNGSVAAFTANNALNPEYIGGYRARVNVNGDTWEVYIPTDDNINLRSSQQFAQVLATGQGTVEYGQSNISGKQTAFNFANQWDPNTQSIVATVEVDDGKEKVTYRGQQALTIQQSLNQELKQERQGIFENFAGNLNQQMSVSKGGDMLLNSDASD